MNQIQIIPRPKISTYELDQAINKANLSSLEYELIEYIRYKGVVSQPSLVKDLRIESKPPALSRLCETSRKIGAQIPTHFEKIRKWSKLINENGIRWDGDLICSTARNIEGIPLNPESGTSAYEILVVHKEFFTGLS